MTKEDNDWSILHALNPDSFEGDNHSTLYPELDFEDVVNKPSHYNNGEIECIEYLKDNLPTEVYHGYLEGNTKKYLHRWRYKQKPIQDLKKAQWYLNKLIEELDGA